MPAERRHGEERGHRRDPSVAPRVARRGLRTSAPATAPVAVRPATHDSTRAAASGHASVAQLVEVDDHADAGRDEQQLQVPQEQGRAPDESRRRPRPGDPEHGEEHQHADHGAGQLDAEQPHDQLTGELADQQGEDTLEHRQVGHARIVPAARRRRLRPASGRTRRAGSTRSGGCRRCPVASIRAYIVVGPTNANPRFFSALDSATDSGEEPGSSAVVAGAGVTSGAKRLDEGLQPAVRTERRSWPARCAEPPRSWPGCGRCPGRPSAARRRRRSSAATWSTSKPCEHLSVALAACAGSSARTARPGSPRGRAARTGRSPRRRAGPTRCRGSRAAGRRNPRGSGPLRPRRRPRSAHPRLTIRLFGRAGAGSGGIGSSAGNENGRTDAVVIGRAGAATAPGSRRPRRGRGR